MADPTEIGVIMKHVPTNCSLLLDVGHLQVSSNSLGFSKFEAMSYLNQYAHAYHINDNDGLVDSHDLMSKDSWFLPHIDASKDITLEIKNLTPNIVKKQIECLNRALSIKR